MPKSKEQFDEIRMKSRASIIAAALKLFVAQGYHETSTGMIAREAGVAMGLMYHYFKSKEELLTEVIEELFRNISINTMREIEKSGGGDAKSVIDVLFTAIVNSSDSWRLIIKVMFQPAVADSARRMIEGLMLRLQGVFVQHFKTVGDPRPQESAAALGGVIHGAILTYALAGNQADLRLVCEKVIEKMLVKGTSGLMQSVG